MKNLRITMVVISFITLLTGCAVSYIPEYSKLKEIERIDYKKNVMDCKHKSVMYHNHLKLRGVESKVVSGIIKGHKTPHVWVEVGKDGKQFLIDPT